MDQISGLGISQSPAKVREDAQDNYMNKEQNDHDL